MTDIGSLASGDNSQQNRRSSVQSRRQPRRDIPFVAQTEQVDQIVGNIQSLSILCELDCKSSQRHNKNGINEEPLHDTERNSDRHGSDLLVANRPNKAVVPEMHDGDYQCDRPQPLVSEALLLFQADHTRKV